MNLSGSYFEVKEIDKDQPLGGMDYEKELAEVLDDVVKSTKVLFLTRLKEGNFKECERIRKLTMGTIDFNTEIKEAFRYTLLTSPVIRAVNIKETFGLDVDLTNEILEGEYEIKVFFKYYFKKGETKKAKRMMEQFAHVVDLKEELKELFPYYLQRGRVDDYVKALDEWKYKVDLSEQVKSLVFYSLCEMTVEDTSDYINRFGKGIDFEDTIKGAFLYCMKECNLHKAFEIKTEFGTGIDFSEEVEFLAQRLQRKGYRDLAKDVYAIF